MLRLQYLLTSVLIGAVLLLSLPFGWHTLTDLCWPLSGVLARLAPLRWAALGALAYALFHRFLFPPRRGKGSRGVRGQLCHHVEFLEVFTHELCHTVVALFTLRRVHSFHAEERSGEIMTSGRGGEILRIPQSLAPYCLPLYTYMLLAIRWMMAPTALWAFDVMVGLTMAFHVYCFKSQTGNHQTDITKYPLLLAYFFIFTAHIVNFSLILAAFRPEVQSSHGLWTAIYDLLASWVHTVAG